MTKRLSLASVIEKNKISSVETFLLALEIDVINPETNVLVETIYLVQNSEDITHKGQVYIAFPFDIELKQAANTQSQITLSIQDITGTVQGQMQLYGGGVGFNVRIKIVNSAILDDEPEVIEWFQVTGASSNGYSISFELGVENFLAKQCPRRLQRQDFCGWQYKEPDTCKYTGSMLTCDRTLEGVNGCMAHNNTINFGGYPGINSNGARYR